MSAYGYKRTFSHTVIYVRFTPESGHRDGCRFTSALHPKADIGAPPLSQLSIMSTRPERQGVPEPVPTSASTPAPAFGPRIFGRGHPLGDNVGPVIFRPVALAGNVW